MHGLCVSGVPSPPAVLQPFPLTSSTARAAQTPDTCWRANHHGGGGWASHCHCVWRDWQWEDYTGAPVSLRSGLQQVGLGQGCSHGHMGLVTIVPQCQAHGMMCSVMLLWPLWASYDRVCQVTVLSNSCSPLCLVPLACGIQQRD